MKFIVNVKKKKEKRRKLASFRGIVRRIKGPTTKI
jgi:hypothetical protein